MRKDRVCGWCARDVVEDEDHFLDGCEKWREGRRRLWDEMRSGDSVVVKRIEGCGRQERVDWMLQGGSSVRTRAVLVRWVGE